MKLNIGCGPHKKEGYINIDQFASFSPDMVMNLESFPWPFETSSVEEIYASHVLEHLGATTDVFFCLIKEIYRVMTPGGLLRITVPHPKHDNFLTDPTHVRAFMPGTFYVFSKERCQQMVAAGGNTTMLALALDIDFALEKLDLIIESHYRNKLQSGKMTSEEFREMTAWGTNMFSEIVVELRCIKQTDQLD